MIRTYLVRGLLVGLLASLVGFAVARTIGEPQVAKAVQLEQQLDPQGGQPQADELVSRGVQATIGLGTGLLVTGIALGGLFALAFSLIYRRVIEARARTTAVLIAAGAFTSLGLVPFLKYPGNPPSVGRPDTLNHRTSLYFVLLVVALLALAAAIAIRRRLLSGVGPWNATLAGAGTYLAIITLAYIVMPGVNEVPAGFPTIVLWRFRLASLGIQAALWTTISLTFGALTERHEAAAAKGSPHRSLRPLASSEV